MSAATDNDKAIDLITDISVVFDYIKSLSDHFEQHASELMVDPDQFCETGARRDRSLLVAAHGSIAALAGKGDRASLELDEVLTNLRRKGNGADEAADCGD